LVAYWFGQVQSSSGVPPIEGNAQTGDGSATLSRHDRVETERRKSFSYEELTKRDKANLDIFWLKDDSLEDSANLPDPDVLAREITEDLEVALEQFAAIAEDLKR
jgi:type I restriction enzyme M protein